MRDVQSRLRKVNQAFSMLRPIWRNSSLKLKTNIRIFKSNVLSVLLCGVECWKTATTIMQKLEVFQNKCLRRILNIFWPNTISNDELRRRTRMATVEEIGHVCRMPADSVTRRALRGIPQGKRNQGRPRATWRRTIVKE